MQTQLLLANPLMQAYLGSDVFGKAIFISLFILSIVTWTLFLQKYFLNKRVKLKGAKLQAVFQKKRLTPFSLEIKNEPHPFNQLYFDLKQYTFELLNKNSSVCEKKSAVYLSRSDMELIESHLVHRISLNGKILEKNLFILSTIVSLSPFLGLLGTVWGILLTFAELQGGSQANEAVMGGLAMALGTTVLGLVVAIPALIAYNYLKAASLGFCRDMEDFSHELLSSVELQYRKIDI